MQKTAVITGAGTGIGFATVTKFLNEGWRVFAVYHESWPDIDGDIIRQKVDLMDHNSIVVAAAEVARYMPEIDVLVNCAGVLLDGDETGADVEKMRRTFEVNVFGTIDFAERLLPFVVDGGHIINVGSVMGAFAAPPADSTAIGYRMSKAALHMYTRALALRLAERDVCVSALHPGWVDTMMGRSVADEVSRPNRTPAEAAEDIYALAVRSSVETGMFWERGEVRGW